MRYGLFFLMILCFQDCGSCDLNPANCERVYRFEIPYAISPDIDTFQIGDTLILTSFIPKLLEDLNSGEMVDVHDHDFKIESGITRMDTLFSALEAISDLDFEYIFDIGAYEFRSTITKVSYEKTEEGQELKIRMIPKKPGVFVISFGNLTRDLINVKLTNHKCRQNLMVTKRMNGDGHDNNFDLLLNSPMPLNWSEAYYETGKYAFVVVN